MIRSSPSAPFVRTHRRSSRTAMSTPSAGSATRPRYAPAGAKTSNVVRSRHVTSGPRSGGRGGNICALLGGHEHIDPNPPQMIALELPDERLGAGNVVLRDVRRPRAVHELCHGRPLVPLFATQGYRPSGALHDHHARPTRVDDAPVRARRCAEKADGGGGDAGPARPRKRRRSPKRPRWRGPRPVSISDRQHCPQPCPRRPPSYVPDR